jgi:hypothetical protein
VIRSSSQSRSDERMAAKSGREASGKVCWEPRTSEATVAWLEVGGGRGLAARTGARVVWMAGGEDLWLSELPAALKNAEGARELG